MNGELASVETDHSPLAGWSVLQTNVIEDAYDVISNAFTDHTFKVHGTPSIADTRLHRMDLGGVTVNYIKYGVDVEIDPNFLENFYLIHMPLHGLSDVWQDGKRIALDSRAAAVCSPSRRSRFRWYGDCGVLAVTISKAAIYDYIQDAYGVSLDRGIQFQAEMTSDADAFWSWRNLIQYILIEADQQNSLINRPEANNELRRLLMTCLLNKQPHNQTDLLSRCRSSAAPRHVRLAEEYIHANISSPISIAELARCANVSERSLFNGFKDFRNTTPIKYITDLRLRRVREDLCRSKHTAKIAEIAAKWGFAHQGAFAKVYRQKFGETPSATLKSLQ